MQSALKQTQDLPELEYRRLSPEKPWVSLHFTPHLGHTHITQINSNGTTLRITCYLFPEEGDRSEAAKQHRAVLHYNPAVENDEVSRVRLPCGVASSHSNLTFSCCRSSTSWAKRIQPVVDSSWSIVTSVTTARTKRSKRSLTKRCVKYLAGISK